MADKYRINIFPRAEQDMESIFHYIAVTLRNGTAANKHIDDFENALNRVCEMPESCPRVNNEYVKDKSLRKLVVNNYIVFYRAVEKNKEIQVIRVLYGMMNFQDIL